MATTPVTSIGSSYQRLGGSTSVIKQGAAGPALSAATSQRLRLAEQRKLDEETLASQEARIRKNIAMGQLDAVRSAVADPAKALSGYEKSLYGQPGQTPETIKQNLATYSLFLNRMQGIV